MITFRGGQQLANGRRTGLGSGFGGVVAYLTDGRREELELAAEGASRAACTPWVTPDACRVHYRPAGGL